MRFANAARAIAIIVAFTGCPAIACAASAPPVPCKGPMIMGGPRDRPPDSEADFEYRLDVSDTLELDMARYMVGRTGDPAVRAFAQHSIDDHSAATAKLAAATRDTGFRPGVIGVGSWDFDFLKAGHGTERDNDYMCLEVRVRREMLRNLHWESDHGQTPALTSLASSLIAPLELQLQVALAYLAAHNLSSLAPPHTDGS